MMLRILQWIRSNKWLGNRYIATILFFIGWMLLLDVANIKNWGIQMGSNAGLRREIVKYDELIKETEMKLTQLKSNNDSLEKYAREQFYMKRDNEVIYLIED